MAATKLPRNVAEALVKAGACDCYGMPRIQMLAELEAILGSTMRDQNGEKVEVRGLTEKEMEFFLAHFGECGSTQKTLEYMVSYPHLRIGRHQRAVAKGQLLARVGRRWTDRLGQMRASKGAGRQSRGDA